MINAPNIEIALRRIGEGFGAALGNALDGPMRLRTRDDVVVTIERAPDSSAVLLSAAVCPLSAPESAACLERAMTRNFFGLDLRDAWLALDEHSGDLTLCTRLTDDSTDERSLSQAILRLCDEAVRTRVAMHSHDAGAATEKHCGEAHSVFSSASNESSEDLSGRGTQCL